MLQDSYPIPRMIYLPALERDILYLKKCLISNLKNYDFINFEKLQIFEISKFNLIAKPCFLNLMIMFLLK